MLRFTRLTRVRTPRLSLPRTQALIQPQRTLATRYPRQQIHPAYRPRRNWTKVLLTVFGGLGLVGGTLWWFYWPHHTFSSGVAKILRKALWAESDRGGHDYAKALKHYLEALEEAKKEKLDSLSDEFTGIQLKVGEMYERLGMKQDALMVYSEISAAYLDALTKPGTVPHKLRPHLIQKDLRVVIKSVELNSQNPQMCKMLLLTHLLVAQEEVAKRSATAAKLISLDHPRQTEDPEEEEIEEHSNPQLLTTQSIKQDPNGKDGVVMLEHNREAWEPFADELFNARDIYVAICLSTGDIASAARAKTATTEWMLNADCHPGEILLSQTNLGSIMYLNAQQFEDRVSRAKQSGASEEAMAKDKKALDQSLRLATKCYESVLEFSKKLPVNLRQYERLDEAIALSTYGLGVVRLHSGDLIPARNLLRESRLRAKGSGFEDLVERAEAELQRVNEAVEKRLAEDQHSNDTKKEDDTDKINSMLADAEKTIDFTIQLDKK